MTVDLHTVTAVVVPVGVTLDVKTLELGLDEGNAPYASARIVCAMPNPDDRALLDMRAQDLRVIISIRRDFGRAWSLANITAAGVGAVSALTALIGGVAMSALTNRFYRPWNGASVIASHTRTANLYVTERKLDDVAQELTLTATSDESRLIDDALISTEQLNPATTSLRTICEKVLARYGAVLSAGTSDAAVVESTATVWQPGQGAWEYLNPLLETASLRLWCNEAGVWSLTPRQSTVDGAVTITPTGTMVGHVDTMTNNPAVWYDAVVIEYRWTDSFGLNNVKYDVAGPNPAKAVLKVERPNTVYPGPGAAAGILNRGQGRGRVLDVDAVSDYRVSPGMATTITPPETPAQTGYLSAVSWRFPDAEMSISTRGLVDTPVTSWLFTPTGKSWLDVPAGVSWLNYTP